MSFIYSRSSKLDFLKFIAATLVIFGHSYGLSQTPDSLHLLSKFDTFGSFAVKIFSFISGFLIIQSWQNEPTPAKFIKKRLYRLLPGLIITSVISVFIIGSVSTSFSILEYFSNMNSYKYLLTAILFPIQTLPGVFTHNPLPEMVNGSLWYIRYILLLNLSIPLLGKIGLFYKQNKIKFLLALMLIFIINTIPINQIQNLSKFVDLTKLHNIIYAILFFYCGVYFWLYKIQVNYALLILPIFIISYLVRFEMLNTICLILLLNLYINQLKEFTFLGIFSKYEISYFLFLLSFPLQQLFISKFLQNPMLLAHNFIFTFPAILLLSFIAHNLIEYYQKRST